MKILNFGSLNMDYVYAVDHFVRPGETVSSLGLQTFCGGKGLNQSVAAARAGCDVYHAGCVGGDGAMLTDALRASGVNTDHVRTVDGATGHAIIQVDSAGQNCILLHGGANQRIDEAFVDSVLRQFAAGDILLLQNEINCLPYIIERAARIGMTILLNPSPMDGKLAVLPLHHIGYFLLNETEGTGLTGESGPEAIAAAMLEQYPGACVVLTLGADGVLFENSKMILRQVIFPVDVADTTAAGDTFTGYFAAGLWAAASANLAVDPARMTEILRRASAASAIAVSRAGASASIPAAGEVDAFLRKEGSR